MNRHCADVYKRQVLTSAILGPVATCIFQLRNNGAAISSGMGTAGLVGPIGIITGWSNMPEGYAVGAFDWLGMILVCFVPVSYTHLDVYKRKHDIHESEDLMIEAFAMVFAKERPIDGKGSFRAYLYKTARNLTIRHTQKHKLWFLHLDDVDFELPSDCLLYTSRCV